MTGAGCTHGITLGSGCAERCAECGAAMQTLVERLRGREHTVQETWGMMRDAADRLEALETQNGVVLAHAQVIDEVNEGLRAELAELRSQIDALEAKEFTKHGYVQYEKTAEGWVANFVDPPREPAGEQPQEGYDFHDWGA